MGKDLTLLSVFLASANLSLNRILPLRDSSIFRICSLLKASDFKAFVCLSDLILPLILNLVIEFELLTFS